MRFNFECEWSNVVVVVDVVACVLTLKSIKLIQLWGSMRAKRPNTHSHARTAHTHTHNNVIKKETEKAEKLVYSAVIKIYAANVRTIGRERQGERRMVKRKKERKK